MVKVGDKMSALRAQQMGSGTRENWANTIIHLLDRLAKASDKYSVLELWESIKSILDDLCKVNRGLGLEIKALLGSTWAPGELHCVMHYSLAIPEAIKTVLTDYQKGIGHDKLFQNTRF